VDFELNETQRLIRQQAADFAARRVAPGARQRDIDGNYPAEIIREMGEYTAGQGSRLALVLLPGMSYVTRPASPSALFQDHVRLFILGVAADSGLVTVDIAAPMRERYKSGDKPDWFFPNEGHYTHDGHQVVADLLRRGLDLWR